MLSLARPAPSPGLRAPLWRAIAVYRVAALAYVGVLTVQNLDEYANPVAAWPILALMVAWTAVTAVGYARDDRRGWPLLLCDLLVALVVVLATPTVVGRAALERGVATLAVAWMVGPVLAWAVSGGRRRGLVAAAVLGAADLLVRQHFDQASFTGATLMLLAAFAVGHLVRLVDDAEQRLQRAVELEAATRERERLARDIHDSVLQVLALVKRRGAGLDGEAGELARLAGEQEVALRALVTAPSRSHHDEIDLMAVLAPYASTTVSVAAPAGAVRLAGGVAREIAAAVSAALDNVTRHCAPGTKVWVLVEDEPGDVTVSVRDDGCGIEPERLTEAESRGRLGVAQSIKGRIAALGGTVSITTAPGQGTEIELTVPKTPLS